MNLTFFTTLIPNETVRFYFFMVLFIVLIAVARKLFMKEEEYPYYENPHFMTESEKHFFKVLKNAVGDKYFICCQVGLISLLKINKTGREWWKHKGKLGQKSVDFVLLGLGDMNKKIVIELDDSSHLLPTRQKRDEFVEKALKVAGIPLVRIKNQSSYNEVEIKKKIMEKT